MVQKMPDYSDALLDEWLFGEEGIDYSDFPLYSTFAYLGITSVSWTGSVYATATPSIVDSS
jgi:hypothetical protein